jgi:predicted CXXCH cytochrome family protein
MRPFGGIATVGIVVAIVLSIAGVGVSLALENQDSFCAACHTEPETRYYQQSLETDSKTLAAFHTQQNDGVLCIDCHGGGGTFGRAEGLVQGADDLIRYISGSYHHPAITQNPIRDDTCLKCHDWVLDPNQSGANQAKNGHYHVRLPKWQAIDRHAAGCVSCHTAHTTGLVSLRYMSQGKVGKLCDACHTALNVRD